MARRVDDGSKQCTPAPVSQWIWKICWHPNDDGIAGPGMMCITFRDYQGKPYKTVCFPATDFADFEWAILLGDRYVANILKGRPYVPHKLEL